LLYNVGCYLPVLFYLRLPRCRLYHVCRYAALRYVVSRRSVAFTLLRLLRCFRLRCSFVRLRLHCTPFVRIVLRCVAHRVSRLFTACRLPYVFTHVVTRYTRLLRRPLHVTVTFDSYVSPVTSPAYGSCWFYVLRFCPTRLVRHTAVTFTFVAVYVTPRFIPAGYALPHLRLRYYTLPFIYVCCRTALPHVCATPYVTLPSVYERFCTRTFIPLLPRFPLILHYGSTLIHVVYGCLRYATLPLFTFRWIPTLPFVLPVYRLFRCLRWLRLHFVTHVYTACGLRSHFTVPVTAAALPFPRCCLFGYYAFCYVVAAVPFYGYAVTTRTVPPDVGFCRLLPTLCCLRPAHRNYHLFVLYGFVRCYVLLPDVVATRYPAVCPAYPLRTILLPLLPFTVVVALPVFLTARLFGCLPVGYRFSGGLRYRYTLRSHTPARITIFLPYHYALVPGLLCRIVPLPLRLRLRSLVTTRLRAGLRYGYARCRTAFYVAVAGCCCVLRPLRLLSHRHVLRRITVVALLTLPPFCLPLFTALRSLPDGYRLVYFTVLYHPVYRLPVWLYSTTTLPLRVPVVDCTFLRV